MLHDIFLMDLSVCEIAGIVESDETKNQCHPETTILALSQTISLLSLDAAAYAKIDGGRISYELVLFNIYILIINIYNHIYIYIYIYM